MRGTLTGRLLPESALLGIAIPIMSQSLFNSAVAEFGRLFRFGLAGCAAFAAYSAAMWVVTSWAELGQVPGAFLGFLVGTSISYIGNSRWVFEKKPTARNVVTFWIVTLFGLAANLVLAYLLERLAFRRFSTVVVIFATVPVLNYIGHRFWTFREPRRLGR
jgi:putative flippase GtrA